MHGVQYLKPLNLKTVADAINELGIDADADATQAMRAMMHGFFMVRNARVFDADGNSLGEGDQIVLLGQYRGDDPLEFTLRGNHRGTARTFRFRLALDAATGKLLWEHRRALPEDLGKFVPFPQTNRNLAIYDRLIIDNGADNTIYALDASEGGVVWKATQPMGDVLA